MRIHTSILVLAMVTSTTASADHKHRHRKADTQATVKEHMKKAAAATTEGRHQDALTELDAAYALDPQPMLLLARGHLYVKLDKCEEAIKLYEEYLATNPAQDMADSATQAIETCKAALAPPPPPPPPPTHVTSEQINVDEENPTLAPGHRPAPVKPRPENATVQVAEPTDRSWFKDPILIGLGAGSAIAITGSVLLYVSARGKLDDAEAAATYEQWSSLDDDAHSMRLYSIICGAAGVALVGGTVFYALRRDSGDDRPRVTLSWTQHGGVVGWAGRF